MSLAWHADNAGRYVFASTHSPSGCLLNTSLLSGRDRELTC